MKKTKIFKTLAVATIIATLGTAVVEPTVASAQENYTVQKGDTLSKIAKKNDTTVDVLTKENQLDDANVIKVGQILSIVSPAEVGASAIKLTSEDITALRSIFNAREYALMYPNVVKELGTDEDVLFNHFIEKGISEGRQPSVAFNVNVYASAYGDLQSTFGPNRVGYYKHYVEYGMNESRQILTMADAAVAGITVYSTDAFVVGQIGVADGTKAIATPSAYRNASSSVSSGSTTPSTTPSNPSAPNTDPSTPSNPSTDPTTDPSSPTIPRSGKYADAYNIWVALQPEVPDFTVWRVDNGDGTYDNMRVLVSTIAPSDADVLASNSDYVEYKGQMAQLMPSDVSNVYDAWLASTPNPNDYEDTVRYSTAIANWYATAPMQSDYLAQTTYAEDYAVWEASQPSRESYMALVGNGLYSDTDVQNAYNSYYAEWLLENPEPQKADYLALTSYSTDVDAWYASNPAPNMDDYTDLDLYDADMQAYDEAEAAFQDTYLVLDEAKINGENYSEAHSDWDASQPTLEEYAEAHPQGYQTEEEANTVYETDNSNWMQSEPMQDDYLAQTTYTEDVATHEASEPSFADYIDGEVDNPIYLP